MKFSFGSRIIVILCSSGVKLFTWKQNLKVAVLNKTTKETKLNRATSKKKERKKERKRKIGRKTGKYNQNHQRTERKSYTHSQAKIVRAW